MYLLSKFLKAFKILTSHIFTINIFIPNGKRAVGIEWLSVAKPQLQNPTLSSSAIPRTTSLISVPHYVNFPELKSTKCLFVKAAVQWGGACQMTPPCPVRIFQRLKNPIETISNFQITFPTEVLENMLNSIIDQLVPCFFINFQKKTVWNSGTQSCSDEKGHAT